MLLENRVSRGVPVQEISNIIPVSRIDTQPQSNNRDRDMEFRDGLLDTLASLSARDNTLDSNPEDPETTGKMNTEDRERLFDSLVSRSTRDGTLDPHPNDTKTEKRDLALAKEIIAEIEKRRRLSKDDLRETMRPRAGPADLRNSRLNADKEMRDLMRPPVGPGDLRNSHLNAEKELREIMRPQPGPADLRNSHFRAGKELREIMKPKEQSSKSLASAEAATDKLVNDLEAAADKLADELDSNIKKRDTIIRRLKESLDGKETTKNDDSNVTTDTCDYNTNEEG